MPVFRIQPLHLNMLHASCRYAREVAQLKTKLAEKDAQLLGGFGSLANLYLGELGPSTVGFPAANPAANFQALNPAVGVGSWGLGPAGLGFSITEGLALDNDLALGQQQGIAPGRYVNPNSPVGTAATSNRTHGYGGAAGAAGTSRVGSPKLEPLAGSSSSRAPTQQQQQHSSAAAGAYQLRAGTAEGSPSRKPGSPLGPLAQQRTSNSAEGLRSGSMNAAAAGGIGPAGSLRRTGSPATVAAGLAAAESPVGRRTGSPAAATGSPARQQMIGMTSGRPTGSPLLQQPRSPLLSGTQTGDAPILPRLLHTSSRPTARQ